MTPHLSLSEHALARYRARADPKATRDEVEAVLRTGVFAARWNDTRSGPASNDGWIIVPAGAFALTRHANGSACYVAMTFMNKKHRPKADRRAFRAQRREEAAQTRAPAT